MKRPSATSSDAHPPVPRSVANEEEGDPDAEGNYDDRGGGDRCLAALGIAACGSSGTSTKEGGTATVLMGTAPDFLDPQEGYTTQSAEATGSATRATDLRARERTRRAASSSPASPRTSRRSRRTARPTRSPCARALVLRRQGRSRPATSRTRSSARSSSTGAGSPSSRATSWAPSATTPASAHDLGHHDRRRYRADHDPLTQPYGAFQNVIAFPSAGLVPPARPRRISPTTRRPASART